MSITTLAVAGYRSLRSLILPMENLTVVTGANGTGKSSLYRSLRLLADVAQDRCIASLAAEGGLDSTMWAGGNTYSSAMRRGVSPIQNNIGAKAVSLRLGFASQDYGYAIDLGFPIPDDSEFDFDPVIKCEAMWIGEQLSRRTALARRTGAVVQIQGEDGRLRTTVDNMAPFESMMMRAADPNNALELLVMRDRMRAWRFYDHFRIDQGAPSRRPQVGTRTVALASDGADLASAIQTIREIGNDAAFDRAIEDAFPGSRVSIDINGGLFSTTMTQEGLSRPLAASELSDGTLRYLLLAAALNTPRPPPLMVLNEPESSLHPNLLAPLARMIATASETSQIIVVSHASSLTQYLTDQGATSFALEKEEGETVVQDIEVPPWSWPER